MLRVQLEPHVFFAVQSSEWELGLVYFKQTPHLEVVLRVQLLAHCHVVVQNFEELYLKHVDFFGVEEGIDKCEVRVAKVVVVPNLLRY